MPERNLPIPKLNWTALCSIYGERCFYCGARGQLERDHLVPLSRGGRHHADNIVPACLACNRRKWAKSAAEYLTVIGRTRPAAYDYFMANTSSGGAVAKDAIALAEQVRVSGIPAFTEPLEPFDRMVVHAAVKCVMGVTSSTSGSGAGPSARVSVHLWA